jgi:uncharacterized protein with PIN domain
MIDITGVDLIQFVKKTYELSKPLGLGVLHYNPSSLSDEEAKEIIAVFKNDKRIVVSMDYIKGRSCKMHVYRKGDKWMIQSPWYGHTEEQFHQLLSEFNIIIRTIEEHNPCCECNDCLEKKK